MRARGFSSAHRCFPLLVLGAVALAVPAVAQTSGGAAATPPTLTTYPACSGQPSKDDSEVAHGAYIAGKRAFDENDYPTAIQYFRDALKRDCTKYELLNIISRAYELEGNRPEAINALQVYLKRAPANDPSAEAIQRRIVNLKALQDAADASAKAAASASASGSAVTTAPTAQPSATSTSEPPPAAPPRGHTVAPWILVGAGVVAVGVGIPLAIIGSNNISSADSQIINLGCDPSSGQCTAGDSQGNITQAQNLANGSRNTGSIEEGIGLGLIGVGAAAVVGGLVWHFVEPTGPATDTSQKATLTVRPDSRPGYQGLSVVGTF